MVGCILTGHGEFASGLGSAVEMIAGPQDNLTVVTFRESEAGDYVDRIAAAITDSVAKYGNTVVYCDLMGGTPFNQAMLISQEVPGVEVVTGTNLPMLLECLTSISNETTAPELAALALEAGQEGIANPVLGVGAANDMYDTEEEGI